MTRASFLDKAVESNQEDEEDATHEKRDLSDILTNEDAIEVQSRNELLKKSLQRRHFERL